MGAVTGHVAINCVNPGAVTGHVAINCVNLGAVTGHVAIRLEGQVLPQHPARQRSEAI